MTTRQRRIIPLVLLLLTLATQAQPAPEAPGTDVRIEDFTVAWVPTRPDLGWPPAHIVTARIVNRGPEPVIVAGVALSLLDAQDNPLRTKTVTAVNPANPLDPILQPGASTLLYEVLPPTNGAPPQNWTGQVRAAITRVYPGK